MQCTHCGTTNPDGMNFCEECGTKLVHRCPSCGQDIRPTAKFCGKCGASLVSSSKPVLPAPVPQAQVSLVEGFQIPSQDSERHIANLELSPVNYTPPHLADRIRAATFTDGERKTI